MRNPRAETLHELNEYVRRGRPGSAALSPQIKIELPPQVERGQAVVLKWQVTHAEQVRLRLVGPGGLVVDEAIPLAGSRRLNLEALGRHTVTVVAIPPAPRAGRRRRPTQGQAMVDVVVPKPGIRLDAPRRMTLGEPLELSWRVTEADQVRLVLDGVPRSVEAAGRLTVHPDQLGDYAVSIEALGQGGRSASAHATRIVAPPVIISIQALAEAELGDAALISYAVTGARTTWLEAIDRKEGPQRIPGTGRIEVPTTLEPERLRVVAEGHDGKRTSKTVTVRSKLFEVSSIDDELALLNGEIV